MLKLLFFLPELRTKKAVSPFYVISTVALFNYKGKPASTIREPTFKGTPLQAS